MSSQSTRTATRWISRLIPVVLAGCFAFGTYVVIKFICVDTFLHRRRSATAIGILVPYCALLVLSIATYTRLLLTVALDPGVIPQGWDASTAEQQKTWSSASPPDDIEGRPYDAGPDANPDSPGLERFYTKDAFVCETDGRPRWCIHCQTWKPDRAHHSREIGRCVKKMDHYCPWTGGIISETSFKFFIQFTFYAALYCVVCLVATALCVKQRVDGRAIAAMALAGFFGLFTWGMAMTSMHYVLANLTNVDALRQKATVSTLAIRVPRGTQSGANYGVIVYPLPRPCEEPASGRDRLAKRTFAIVRTEKGENPWHLGLYRNWVSVMGTNAIDWLLPIRKSPCAYQESDEGFYQMGPLIDTLRSRYGLPGLPHGEKGGGG